MNGPEQPVAGHSATDFVRDELNIFSPAAEVTTRPTTDLELIEDQLVKAAAAPTLTGRAMHLAIAAGIGLSIATYGEQDDVDGGISINDTYADGARMRLMDELRASRRNGGLR
jgi:hypothetical protein